ncbi:MAG: hypothetical protein AB1767_11645 [Bacillota bacterium]
MRKTGILILVLACLLILSGCSCGVESCLNRIPGFGDADTADDSDLPIDTEDPSSGQFTIEVVNATDDYNVCYFFVSDSDSEDWGDDYLGDSILYPGDSFSVTLDQGSYDIMLGDSNNYVLHTAWNVSSGTRIEVGGAGKIPLVVLNQSEYEVAYMYISPSNSDEWGSDWLADSEVIPPHEGARVFFLNPGTYDLRADDLSNETVAGQEAVQLTEASTWTIYN